MSSSVSIKSVIPTIAGLLICAMSSGGAETKRELPIVGVGKVKGYSFVDSTTMRLMADAGINISQCTIDPGTTARSPKGDSISDDNRFLNFDLTVENARREGMQVMMRVWDSGPKNAKETDPTDRKWAGWYQLWTNLVKRYGEDPAIYGWQLSDEPPVAKFEILRAAKDTIQKYDPQQRPVYVNMIPFVPNISRAFGPVENCDIKDYDGFISRFDEVFDPEILSYDSYGVGKYDGRRYRKSDIYRNLAYYRRRSEQGGKPFWAYVLGMEVTYPKTATHRHETGYWTPDAVSMGLEARSALAFGAQGLVYWTMVQRPDAKNADGDIVEAYPSAPIDLYGNPTPLLDAVRKVNSDIRRYEDIFVGGTVKDVVFTKDPAPKEKLGLDLYDPDAGFGPVRSVTSDGDGLTLSRIENEGRNYLVIVSFDIDRNQQVRLQFDRPMKHLSTNQTTTHTEITISPGAWAIFSEE